MILVGHNYGITKGVFVGLTRLISGDKVQVVTKAGETYTYRVTTVKRVKWRRKNFAELTQHLAFPGDWWPGTAHPGELHWGRL